MASEEEKKDKKKKEKNKASKAVKKSSANNKPDSKSINITLSNRWRDDDFPGENVYYTTISKHIKYVKYCVILTLVVFCLAMISFYRSEITVENFRYMIRDLDASSKENEFEFNEIIYDNLGSAQFGNFKNELAVIKGDTVALYNLSGSSVLRASANFYNPQMYLNGKYMLVYDIGQTTYSYTLYNSFSELHSEKMDYPITGGTVSPNGTYAILSSTKDYRGAIYIYNDSFKQISRIFKDKYVSDISINKNSSDILIVSAYSDLGDWCSEIQISSVQTGEEKFRTSIDGSMAVKASYFSSGEFVVIFDNKAVFYDSTGSQTGIYPFNGSIPVSYYINDNYIAFAFNKNVLGTDKNIVILNSSGEQLFSDTITGQITNIDGNSRYLYVLTDHRVYRIDFNNQKTDSLATESNANKLVVFSDYVVICYSNRAIIVKFDDNIDNTANETAAVTDG